MASRGRGARIKGAQFERDIANWFSEQTNLTFKRGLLQTRGGGKEECDMICKELPDLHFELKRQQKCNIKAAMEQALKDIDKTNKIPIIVTKDDREKTLVTMQLEDWMEIFKEWINAKIN